MLSDRCCSKRACRGVTGSPVGLAGALEPPARAAWCQGVTDRAPRLQSDGFINSRNYNFTCILSSARLNTNKSIFIWKKSVFLYCKWNGELIMPFPPLGVKTWGSATCRRWPLWLPCVKRLRRTPTASQIQNHLPPRGPWEVPMSGSRPWCTPLVGRQLSRTPFPSPRRCWIPSEEHMGSSAYLLGSPPRGTPIHPLEGWHGPRDDGGAGGSPSQV